MKTNRGKRLLVALALTVLALTVLAIAACSGTNPAISAGAAAPNTAAQPAPEPPGAVDAATSSSSSIGSRVIAAAKVAEAAPHGDIGEAAVATAP